jgi:xylan 1,4-beta-xylosidase
MSGSWSTGLHHTVDAWVVRQRDGVTIVLTNHALPRHPIRRERVRLTLRNSARPRLASIRRIDEGHANARRAWQRLGEPEYLSSRMVERLECASRIREDRCAWEYANRTAYLEVDLPAHGTWALTDAHPWSSRAALPEDQRVRSDAEPDRHVTAWNLRGSSINVDGR